jgi:hypothetical protein
VEHDDWDYYEEDKPQTDYVTDDIFFDEAYEHDFIGDYNYPYIEPDELYMDRNIVTKMRV